MTLEDLKKIYGLPEKILREYLFEFLANTPGSEEFAAAEKLYNEKIQASWSWQGGAQDQPATFSVTAFSPPAAFVTNQTNQGAWMLDRITNGSDRAYYQVNFSGYIDYRLGSFGLSIYPVKVYDQPFMYWRYYAYQGHIDAWVNRNPFSGLPSMIAQYENGFPIDYDIQRVKAALAYVSAIQKYSTELQTKRELAKQQAASDINSMARDLSDRLRRESSDLSQKKLALMVAIDNEKKSAIRDMQNLLLNAQSIRL